MYLESRVSRSSWFLTLTYSDECMPTFEGAPCFDRKEVDRYIRALRDDLKVDGIHLRYFFTCEEGDLSSRIHYHALLFLDGFLSLQQVYMLCKKHWHDQGWISVSSTGVGCCKYVAKYCLKDSPSYQEPRKLLDGSRNPFFPFRLFSNRPGLGCSPECISYYESVFGLGESYISWDQVNLDRILNSQRVIPKVPRTVRHHLSPDTQSKLTSVGWSRFFSMQDDLKISSEDDELNPFCEDLPGEFVRLPNYQVDLDIIRKRIKLRQLKKNVL